MSAKTFIATKRADLERNQQVAAALAIEYICSIRRSIYPSMSSLKPFAMCRIQRNAIKVAVEALELAIVEAEDICAAREKDACKAERLDNNSLHCMTFRCIFCDLGEND